MGYLWFLKEEQKAFLCDFYVAPDGRRQGCGKAALAEFHKMAAESGCSKSVLFVADRNTAARNLYEKCGYSFLRKQNYGCFMSRTI